MTDKPSSNDLSQVNFDLRKEILAGGMISNPTAGDVLLPEPNAEKTLIDQAIETAQTVNEHLSISKKGEPTVTVKLKF